MKEQKVGKMIKSVTELVSLKNVLMKEERKEGVVTYKKMSNKLVKEFKYNTLVIKIKARCFYRVA